MMTFRKSLLALTALLWLSGMQPLFAQGTAFTYQGMLSQNGSAANGTNDLLFTLYATNGSVIGQPVTNPAVAITNGLFLVTLDFGANSFTNTPRLLSIGVRPTGSTNGFTPLSPMQQIFPAPQAIFAGTAAGVVNGSITAASLSPGVGANGLFLEMSSGTLVWGLDSGGTISNLATGFGLVGGPITNNGTLAIDTTIVPQLGAANVFSTGQTIQSGNAANQALVLSGAAGQTTNLQEWRNSLGTVLASVNAAGVFNGNVNGSISGNGSGLTSLNGAAITSGTITAGSIASGQVVKNLNGLMDSVVLAPGNNMILATNANTLTFNTAPGLLSWLVVPGTTQTAQSNKGYLLTNTALTTVTLPASPSLADIVRVSGISTNGWMIAQNAGQSIFVKSLPGNIGVTWTPRATSLSWVAIAASSDASKLVAATAGGQLYYSINSGATWAEGNGNGTCVASSSDGTTFVAALNGGKIYTSTDYGATWNTGGSIGANWISVASSASAGILAAAVSSEVYLSTDRGVTWTPNSSPPGGFLAILPDGSKIFDLAGGKFYYSTNGGTSWLTNYTAPSLSTLAFSSDGTKMVGTSNNSGPIYLSSDSGNTWTNNALIRNWSAVASSADGTHLAATVTNGQIYISADSGMTWYAHSTNRAWSSLISSSDGTRLAATVNSGQIYTSDNLNPVTTTGTAGYLLGVSNAAVELQYIGNNQFIPLSSAGFVTGN
jgi:hypothetical protein